MKASTESTESLFIDKDSPTAQAQQDVEEILTYHIVPFASLLVLTLS